MDAHRGDYSEEPEPRWFGGEEYGEPDWERRDQRRVPEPRNTPGYGERAEVASAHSSGTGPIGPRSGEPLPPYPAEAPAATGEVPRAPGPSDPRAPDSWAPDPRDRRGAQAPRPAGEPPRYQAQPIERRALRRSAGTTTAGDGIYRARRPAVAVLIGAVTAVAALPVLRVLLSAAFGKVVVPSGVLSSVLFLLALPLSAIGLYALATGSARVPDAPVTHAWLRPPLAYLTAGLVLFVVAGLAV